VSGEPDNIDMSQTTGGLDAVISMVILVIILAAGVSIYMLPAIVSQVRHHHQSGAGLRSTSSWAGL
jgi:hypothetical protein